MDEAAERSTLPILAVDLGGTRIRAAIVTPDLEVRHRRSVATGAADGPDAVIDRICGLANQILAEAAGAGVARPRAVGISAPGPLDARRGLILSPPNLPGWNRVRLTDAVERATGLPALLERDTNVAMMAEWRHGAARGSDDAVYVTVSTGIGGGIVAGGRPLVGPDGTAGEIGHLTVELDGPLCGDGMPGHVEALGSGAAIAREGRALLASGAAPGLAELATGAASVDAELVARAADGGDAACASVLARAWTAIGAMCAGLVNVLNPEVIVLGGSIALRRPELRSAVRAQIDRRAFAVPAARVRVEMAEHADDVSLIGWLPLIRQRLDDPAHGKERA